MPLISTTLRPGLLVSLKTSVNGGVAYSKTILQSEVREADGRTRKSWETERTIIDKAEHDAASKVRSKAGSLVRGVCALSAFGLLCPETAAEALVKAIAEARALVSAFNTEAKVSKVSFGVITGRIEPQDAEAVKAINSEVRGLLAEMADGLDKLDVKRVREAAGRAKQLGSMLSPEAEARIRIVLDQVRGTAKRMVKAGEQAALEIDRRTINLLTEARTAFLDLDSGQADIVAPTAEGRGVDLTAPDAEAPAPSAAPGRQVELA